MGIRIYCDNCGHTANPVHRMTYGPAPGVPPLDHAVWDDYPMATLRFGNPIQVQSQGSYIPPVCEASTVELYNNCVEIWMNRVKNLTARSNP